MNDQYQFRLIAETPDGKQHIQAFRVEAFAAPQFAAYDLCSEPISAMLAGGVMRQEAARINTERKALAYEIATRLTEAILTALATQDLKNGYTQ